MATPTKDSEVNMQRKYERHIPIRGLYSLRTQANINGVMTQFQMGYQSEKRIPHKDDMCVRQIEQEIARELDG